MANICMYKNKKSYSDIEQTNPTAAINTKFLEAIMESNGFIPYFSE